MFTQDKNDDFDWLRHMAANRDPKYTPNTGPSADRTGSKQGKWIQKSKYPLDWDQLECLQAPLETSFPSIKRLTEQQ